MVPLFILDKKSPLKLEMDSKHPTPVESWHFNKHKKGDQELSKCLDGTYAGEVLLKSYACAWHRDILVQGRLLLTDNWFCFYSNIIGWETKTKINLKNVTSISKQKTALVIPNAILVETVDKKFTFSSFMHRDRAYKIMLAVWENFNQNKPISGESFRQYLRSLKKGRLKKCKSWETSSDAEVESCSPDLSSSPSPSPDYLRSSSLPSTAPDNSSLWNNGHSPGNDSSDWTDASLEVDSPGTDVDDNSSSSHHHTSTQDSCNSSLDRRPVLDDDSSSSDSDSSSLVASSNVSPCKTTPTPASSSDEVKITKTTEAKSMKNSKHWTGQHWWREGYQWLWHLLWAQDINTSSRMINFFILVFIVVLLLSLTSMVCQLCTLEPSLQPYLAWQPWCSCLPPARVAIRPG